VSSVASFEQVKRKKAPFKVVVTVGSETFHSNLRNSSGADMRKRTVGAASWPNTKALGLDSITACRLVLEELDGIASLILTTAAQVTLRIQQRVQGFDEIGHITR
jgi:hypothetical protein